MLDEIGEFGKAKKKKKKRRSQWCRSWLHKRNKWSHVNLLHRLHDTNESDFENFLKMSEDEFDYLLSLVRPLISRQDTWMRKPISDEARLVVTLRFLATGSSLEDLTFSAAISAQALGKIIPEICRAIYIVLKDEYLKVSFILLGNFNCCEFSCFFLSSEFLRMNTGREKDKAHKN
jgi:hypothetical protein